METLNLRALESILETVEANDDEEGALVRAARGGDASAWDDLLGRYQLRLFGFARRLLGDRDDALDAVQETFIAAIRHIGSLRDEHRFAGWLFAIARQQALQVLRRRKRAIIDSTEELPDTADQADGAYELAFRADQGALIEREIALLPEPQRAVILLHYFLDLPLGEIAEIMETPVGTVKSRLHVARRALRVAFLETAR